MPASVKILSDFFKWAKAKKKSLSTYKAYDGHTFIIVWKNILTLMYFHGTGLYGLVLMLMGYPRVATYFWVPFLTMFAGLGVTAGAHRLWSHRTYKAKLPLRILLAFCMCFTFQNSIYEWCRDHRVHHKFSETNADPHNAKRGFFFSHVGWLMVKKHKEVIEKGKTVDVSDLEQDAVVMFQDKYYAVLMPLLTFVVPTIIPYYFWNEDLVTSFFVSGMFTYTFSVNGTWCINSVAHLYGIKPYDKNIGPTENKAMFYLAYGEGYHNYHHSFPWDYKASEFGGGWHNTTTWFIDLFAKIGWVTERKEASPELIRSRALRSGDGSWENVNMLRKNFKDKYEHKNDVWGWGDKAMPTKEKESIIKSNYLHRLD